jgi:hypothetical protein
VGLLMTTHQRSGCRRRSRRAMRRLAAAAACSQGATRTATLPWPATATAAAMLRHTYQQVRQSALSQASCRFAGRGARRHARPAAAWSHAAPQLPRARTCG